MQIGTSRQRAEPDDSVRNEIDDVTRRRSRRYIPGLAAIATLIIAGSFLVWQAVVRQSEDGKILAVAGRQITLSYEIDRAAGVVALGEEETGAPAAVLLAAATDLERGHEALLEGDEVLGLGLGGSDAVAGLVSALDPAARRIVDAADRIAAEGAATPPERLAALHRDTEIFRAGMEISVAEQQQSSTGRLENLQRVGLGLLLAILAALVLEGLFLFRPAARQIHQSWRERDERHAEERARDQERLTYLSQFDPVTGLLNRARLRERLRRALLRAGHEGGLVTVISLDLDGFKAVNDLYGHHVGDALLAEVASRLTRTVRESDLVARLGGDEFAVVLPDTQRVGHAETVARKLLDVLAGRFEVADQSLFVTASAGIAIFPLDADNVDDLLRDADLAMHAAKGQGPNSFCLLTDGLRQQTSERLQLIDDLRAALEEPEQFTILYQPKVDMGTGRVFGVEALLRWHHPELGLIMPARFIPLAEESDLIVPLGRLVLDRACAQATEWLAAGRHTMTVSVNVSSRQFRQGDLVETVAAALAAAGLDPRFLEVELTESTLIADDEATVTAIERLKDMGVSVSIDDFGTGYSSLSYLKRFAIDAVKIDRSFVSEITENADDAAISEAIVGLGRSLRLKVIAEGVETPEQLEYLRSIGCDAAQGFLFSRPVPPEHIHDVTVVFPQAASF